MEESGENMNQAKNTGAVSKGSLYKRAGLILLIAFLYFLIARFGLTLSFEGTNASPIWPASGFALAVILMRGYKIWPGIWLGAFGANMVIFLANFVPVQTAAIASLLIASGNTLEAVIGKYLYGQMIKSETPFEKTYDFFRFVLIATIICAFASSIGTISSVLLKINSGELYEYIWWTWYVGDFAGIIVVAPLILSLWKETYFSTETKRYAESLVLYISVFIISSGIFEEIFPGVERSSYVLIPFLLWAAFRLGLREVSITIAIISVIAIRATISGKGPFVVETVNVSLILLELFICIISITIFAIVAAIADQRRLKYDIEKAQEELEQKVHQRTNELLSKEKDLEESQQQLKDIVENATNLFYSHTTNHVLTYLSPATIEYFGMEPEEAMKRWTDFLTDNAINQIGYGYTLKAIETGKKQPPYELELYGKNEKIRVLVNETPLVKNGKTVGIVGSLMDITSRVEAEQRLKESEEKFRALSDTALDAIVSTDSNGNITYLNKAAENIFGYFSEEITGKRFILLLSEEFHNFYKEGIQKILSVGVSPLIGKSIEMGGKRKDGTRFSIDFSMAYWKSGKELFFTSIIRDITERKRSAKELQESEERYRELFNNTTDLIHSIAPDGSILYVNQAWENTLGYRKDELSHLSIYSLIPTNQQKDFNEKIKTSMEGQKVQGFETELITKQGEQIVVEGNINCEFLNGKPHSIQMFLRDITSRKIKERELEQETKHIKLLQKVAIASNQALSIEEAMQAALKEVCKSFGWSAGHFFNVSQDYPARLESSTIWFLDDLQEFKRFKEITESTDFNTGESIPRKVLDTGKSEWITNISKYPGFLRRAVAGECGIKTAIISPILIGYKISGISEFFSQEIVEPDEKLLEILTLVGTQLGRVIERKRAEEELLKSEEMLSEAQRIAHIGNWEWDIRTNKIDWSDELYRIFGLKPGEFKASYENFLKYIHPDDRDTINSIIQQASKDHQPFNFFHRIIRPDGTIRVLHALGNVFTDNYGNTIRMVGIGQDVTELKEIENELRKAKEVAEKSVKTKELFLANMSHEIRTPLNGIIGFTKLLKTTPLNSTQKEYLKLIKTSGENLLEIINDILDFSKIEAGKITFEAAEFKLEEVIDSGLELIKSKAEEKNLKLYKIIDAKIQKILLGDALRLKQIILNLISNSVKFTDKGEIKINAKLIMEDSENATIEFEVRDTGIGIPNDKLNLIFESFTQESNSISRKYGGTGLGLAITKQLIEHQGGFIEAESELNKGTIFRFQLTFKKTNLEVEKKIILPQKQHENTSKGNESLENVSILCVEDNSTNQYLILEIVKSWGCNVEIAENGKAAVEKLAQKDFDLILMDIQMPILDGYETTDKIRKELHNEKIPIIAMTAHAMRGEREKCISYGMNDYISKPFDPDDLRTKILQNLKESNERPITKFL